MDEAHNLADRARDMYSAELFKQLFMPYRKFWKESVLPVYQKFQAVNKWFTAIRNTFENNYGTRVVELPGELVSRGEFTGELGNFLQRTEAAYRIT